MNNEIELTAALLTIEKSRELSGCPAGVDLQNWVKMLVSELSVVEEIHNSAVFITDELYDASPKEVQGIIRSLACMKMPAYARIVAGIKADGVEEFVSNTVHKIFDESEAVSALAYLSLANSHVKQLREGAK